MNQYSKFIKQRDEIITEPFKGDLWDRKPLSEKLTNFVSKLDCGATIALDAEWGAGKTWFVNNWKADLTSKEFKVICIDAFKHDFMEDPFLILSMEILNALDADKTLANKFKERLISTYQAILPNLPMLLYSFAMTAIGAGHFSQSLAKTVNDIKDAAGEFGEDAGELMEEQLREHLTELVENYNKSKNELGYFKDELSKLVENLEKPLVFIVDELDRCKPEFSIKLIERIKHFFDIPNIVFVLSTNKAQLEESINSFYGFKANNSYLEKFIDINIKFPKRNNDNYRQVIFKYVKLFNLKFNNKEILLLANVFNINSRGLIKILQKMALIGESDSSAFPIMAFIYLAMEQKSMTPENMSQSDYLNKFVKMLSDYVKSIKQDPIKNYNFDNLIVFADYYGRNDLNQNSGLAILLRYYYLQYTGASLTPDLIDLRGDLKDLLKAKFDNVDEGLVKNWADYIGSGFIIG